MTIRSKHNNLLNYFLYDSKNLSKAYIKKCEQFLNKLGYENKNGLIKLKRRTNDKRRNSNRVEVNNI